MSASVKDQASLVFFREIFFFQEVIYFIPHLMLNNCGNNPFCSWLKPLPSICLKNGQP